MPILCGQPSESDISCSSIHNYCAKRLFHPGASKDQCPCVCPCVRVSVRDLGDFCEGYKRVTRGHMEKKKRWEQISCTLSSRVSWVFRVAGRTCFGPFSPVNEQRTFFFANPKKPMIPGRASVKFYSRSKNIAQFVFF